MPSARKGWPSHESGNFPITGLGHTAQGADMKWRGAERRPYGCSMWRPIQVWKVREELLQNGVFFSTDTMTTYHGFGDVNRNHCQLTRGCKLKWWLTLACFVAMFSIVASGQNSPVTPHIDVTSPVPPLLRFNGVLRDVERKPRKGVAGVIFSIYSDSTGGAPLWQETQNVQLDSQGRFSILLGASKTDGIPVELFVAGEPRWLGVQAIFPGESEQPRVLLVSVPYAMKAADADT